MGKTRNEKKTRKGLSSNIQSYTNNGEYDLESNFRKIRPYTHRSRKKNPPHGVTDSSEDFSRKRYQENYVDSSAPTSLQTASGSAFWDSYCRLDDKISDYKEKNEVAHSDLRQELEQKINISENKQNEKIGEINNKLGDLDNKIDKRLSIQWYSWTIGGIVAIVTIWFIFSYKEVAETPRKIQSIENKIDFIEKNMQKRDYYLDSLYIKKK